MPGRWLATACRHRRAPRSAGRFLSHPGLPRVGRDEAQVLSSVTSMRRHTLVAVFNDLDLLTSMR